MPTPNQRPAWQFDLAARAREVGFGSLRVLENSSGTVFYDGTPGLLRAFSSHSFTVLERETELPYGLRLVHQSGLQGEVLFREDSQGRLILTEGMR
ncbi:hypothetical protein AB4Y72_16460 [Arthrobacter sp. YAF34]|uniref:hypothetical protein n=1 Tax=Arthrobacter sp. YAF34 TaxID=3233083 RepID=UPI003F9058C0